MKLALQMNKTKIEWCDYTINPVKGLCPVGCSYCYARAMYHRYKWEPAIRYQGEIEHAPMLYWSGIEKLKRPSRMFVGSTMELFGEWIKVTWLWDIFDCIKRFPQHTFIFLTKRPENLSQFSPFPENCWVGCSCTDQKMFTVAADYLAFIDAPVKFISFEPLLGQINYGGTACQEMLLAGINWIIIGQQTPVRKSTTPQLEWVRDIVQAAGQAGIPVFLKDNLKSLIPPDPLGEGLRQEFPETVKC